MSGWESWRCLNSCCYLALTPRGSTMICLTILKTACSVAACIGCPIWRTAWCMILPGVWNNSRLCPCSMAGVLPVDLCTHWVHGCAEICIHWVKFYITRAWWARWIWLACRYGTSSKMRLLAKVGTGRCWIFMRSGEWTCIDLKFPRNRTQSNINVFPHGHPIYTGRKRPQHQSRTLPRWAPLLTK